MASADTRLRKAASRALPGLAMILAGGTMSAIPALLQAIGARHLAIEEQSVLALALSFGGAVAGIASATVLEARLATPQIRLATYVPRVVTWIGFAGAVGMLLSVPVAWLWFLAVPAVMTALQFGRVHATVTLAWRRELVAASAVGLSFLVALLLPTRSIVLPLLALAIGCGVAIGLRASSVRPGAGDQPAVSARLWIGVETGVLAFVPFILNLVVLTTLGAEQAVAFRLILTVLGVLQPLLGFMRTRLLSSHSVALVVAMSSLSVTALACILVVNAAGLFDVLFQQSWESVTTTALVVACMWKLGAVPGAVPFATLRRRGLVRTVFWTRVASTVISVSAALLVLTVEESLAALFGTLLVAELATTAWMVVLVRRSAVRTEPKADSASYGNSALP